MKITIEIKSKRELEQLSKLLKTFEVSTFNFLFNDMDINCKIRKGDKNIDPEGLFGIWADKPRSLENIRRNAWQRKYLIPSL